MKEIAFAAAIAVLLSVSACQRSAEAEPEKVHAEPVIPPMAEPSAEPPSVFPNLQAEILDDRFKRSTSPLASFDFKNFTYPLPQRSADTRHFQAMRQPGMNKILLRERMNLRFILKPAKRM